MKIKFNEEMVGLAYWDLKSGDVVEVLENRNGIINGTICLFSDGKSAGLKPFLVSLEDGQMVFPTSEARFRLLEAEITVKAYEGR